MTGDLLDRLERELIDGMRRHDAHPRRAALRRYRPRQRMAATVAAALALTALLSLSGPWPTRDEEPLPIVATAPPPPPHIVNRNWKPVRPDVNVFQLILSATSWTAIPDHQNAGRHGALRWSGRRFAVSPDPPCNTTGVYRVDHAKSRMTITAEDDPCVQRRDLLERAWFTLP